VRREGKRCSGGEREKRLFPSPRIVTGTKKIWVTLGVLHGQISTNQRLSITLLRLRLRQTIEKTSSSAASLWPAISISSRCSYRIVVPVSLPSDTVVLPMSNPFHDNHNPSLYVSQTDQSFVQMLFGIQFSILLAILLPRIP